MSPESLRGSRFIVSAACVGAWGSTPEEMKRWLVGSELGVRSARKAPPVPGFIESQFNPLVYEVARRCLSTGGGDAGTAIVLGSGFGDTTTADLASQNVAKGNVHNPLLFFQSVPTSILGHIAREFGIVGPLTCLAGGSELSAHVLEMADMLLDRSTIEQVLVLGVELQLNPRTTRVHALLGNDDAEASLDIAVGMLLRRSANRHDGTTLATSQSVTRVNEVLAAEGVPAGLPSNWNAVRGLVALYMAYEHVQAAEARTGPRSSAESIDKAG
jgi:hypothetical protein